MINIEKVITPEFEMKYFKFGSGKKAFVILPGLSVTSVMDAAQAVESSAPHGTVSADRVISGDHQDQTADQKCQHNAEQQ